ncbi:VWF-like protein [Mya arenaria]|uniref:VWF-like protein n=1 Tax=Mya arenaria TaxID=6604 RepID=A0ABY7E496_MYAAR|nr:VWF-like protein [Mya arenaria]
MYATDKELLPHTMDCINKALTLILVLRSFRPAVAVECVDLDGPGCASLLAQNTKLCENEVFARTACQRTCGLCAVTCYHCDQALISPAHCNTTKACQPGERCMVTEVASSRDGHHEFHLNCAALEVCDGSALWLHSNAMVVGRRRRDISSHCCDTDLCNQASTATQPPSTTLTTTSAPTTVTQTCTRDILFMVEYAEVADAATTSGVRQFLVGVTSSIAVGPTDNHIAISMYDSGINHEVRFKDIQETHLIVRKINSLVLDHRRSSIDLNHVINNLHHKPETMESVRPCQTWSSSYPTTGRTQKTTWWEGPSPEAPLPPWLHWLQL